MNFNKRRIFTFVFSVFLGFSAAAQAPEGLYGSLGTASDKVPAKRALRSGYLPNGLRYYILENRQPRDRVFLTLAVNAGSVLEKDDEQGLAHFVEHMAFNGTRRFPANEMDEYIRSLGMRNGADFNAYTGYDQTVYGLVAPTETGADGKKTIPDKALEILDDWTYALSFDPAQVDAERPVILEEYRMRLGASDRLWEKMLAEVARGSRYADRKPIGLPDIIRTAPPERLEGFYRRWYRCDNMAVILVGDFDGESMEKGLASRFSAPPSGNTESIPDYELPAPQPGLFKASVISDPELPDSSIYLFFKQEPKALDTTLETYRSRLMEQLVSTMLDYRSDDAVNEPDAPFLDEWIWTPRFGRKSRFFVLAASAISGKTEDALTALFNEKESMLRYGFTGSELDRAKTDMLSYAQKKLAESDHIESEDLVRDYVWDFYHGDVTPDPDWALEAMYNILPGIDLAAVNAETASYFRTSDLTAIVSAPDWEKVPDEEKIAAIALAAQTAEIAAPEENDGGGSLVETAPEMGTVVSERTDPSGDLVWTLGNGATIILRKTENRNNELVLSALARGGTSSADKDDIVSVRLSPELAALSGLGPHSRKELNRLLSGVQASLSFRLGEYQRGFRGASDTGAPSGENAKDPLETLFQLLYLNFTAFRITPEAIAVLSDQYRSILLQEKGNPESEFNRAITRLLYGNDPAFRPLEAADLEKLNADAARSFLDRALNPADYTFVFAGNFDTDRMRALIRQWIASIPEKDEHWNEWSAPNEDRPLRADKKLYMGKDDKCIVFMSWESRLPWTQRRNAAALVLNGYLDILCNDIIREKIGGVYSLSPWVYFRPAPEGSVDMQVYFTCDPAREAELKKEVQILLDKAAAGELDENILAQAREALVKSFETSMQNNAFVAQNLANFAVIAPQPLVSLNIRPELYRSISAEEVRRCAAELAVRPPLALTLFPESADNDKSILFRSRQ